MFWLLILMVLAVGTAYYRWSRRKLYRITKEIPCLPNSYPIVGHAFMFLGDSEDRMKALQQIGRVSNEQNGLASIWLANRLFVCVTDPATIELVTKSCLAKDEFTIKFTRLAIGNGSIFAPVNIWHPRRKISAPFFKLKTINSLVPIFNQQSSIMVDFMRAEVGSGDFSIWNYITTYTFDSICKTGGVEMNSQGHPDHFALRAVDEVTQMIAKRMLQPWLHPDFIYKNLPVYKHFQKHLERVDSYILKVIQEQRSRIAADGSDNNNNKNMKDSSNFIEFLIKFSGGLENGYSDSELREEMMVLATAGTDTSATAVSFTAVLLSRYLDVQEKVHQELQEVFGDSDRAVTAEDLTRLKYLEAVLKESLRLYPPVPVIVRQVHDDIVLPSGPTLVDGTAILINIWASHRNPAYWGADAELFRPERFLEGPLRSPAQFIPFSYSVRNCIGATYAMMSAKTALANLLRRYRLLPPSGARASDLQRPLPVKFDIMMKAVDNFIVRIVEKKNNKIG